MMNRRIQSRFTACIGIIVLLGLVAPVAAGTITISPGDSIQLAINSAGNGDRIILNPGIYYENNITFSTGIVLQANTTAGGNRENTIIDGSGGPARILSSQTTGTTSLAIDNLTLRNGYAPDRGGALYTNGSVTVTSSAFLNCSAQGDSGAISAEWGNVTVRSSTFTNSSANGDGGTIKVIFGNLSVSSSTFTNSSALGDGGAIKVIFGDLSVTGSTFSSCSTHGDGGAIKVIFGNLSVNG
jgi:hypothetical protein